MICMKVRELFNILCDYTITQVKISNENAVVNKTAWLDHEQTDFEPSTLYLIHYKKLPLIFDANTGANFLCFGNFSVVNPILHSFSHNVFHLRESNDAEISRCYETIRQLLAEDNLILQKLEPVLDALWNDHGLQNIVNIAAQIIRNPVYITDMSYKFLAYSVNYMANGILDEEIKSGHILQQNIDLINNIEMDPFAVQAKLPYYFINENVKQGMMVDKVKINGIEIAHVMISESYQPISELDKKIIRYFCKIISIELQKDSFYKDNKGVKYSYFLADLLDNHLSSPHTIEMRLNTLGIKLHKNMQLVIVRPNTHSTAHSLDILVKQLHLLLPQSMYVVYKNSVVLLLNQESLFYPDNAIYKRIKCFLHANAFTMGVSNPFSDISKLQIHYKQAIKAAEIGNNRLGIKSGAIYFKDISFLYLLEISNKTEENLHFCHPDISFLIEYDELHHTELSHTLMVFLFNGQNTAKTSNLLNIHKNTLLYRINKIKKILNTSLENGDDLFSYQLSFKILNYNSLQ